MVTLGDNIRKARKKMGLTQEELADKLYVSRQTISSWENDKSYPDIHSLLMISDLFGVSLDSLIKGDIEISSARLSNVLYIQGFPDVKTSLHPRILKLFPNSQDDFLHFMCLPF